MKNMKNIKTSTYTFNDKSYDFNFATNLSAYRKSMFVNYVVNSIVDDDRYDSIVKPLIFDFGLIAICTNIDTSFINREDDEGNPINPIIFIEHFLEETNVVDIVKANMEVGVIAELYNAVEKSIEYRTGIHPNPLNDALASLFSALEKKVNEFDMGSMMEMAQKFASMTGDLNADSIVRAYVDSDAHKKNVKEVVNSKKNNKTKKNEIKMNEALGEAVRAVIEENKAEKAEMVD